MPFDIIRRLKLREDRFRQDFPKLYTHLVYILFIRNDWGRGREEQEHTERVDTPNDTLNKDLVFIQGDQRTYARTISMSHRAGRKDSIPSVSGVKSGKMILLLGLFPSNTLLFTRASLAPLPSSFRTCVSVLPNANASGCAKKLERRIRWCLL